MLPFLQFTGGPSPGDLGLIQILAIVGFVLFGAILLMSTFHVFGSAPPTVNDEPQYLGILHRAKSGGSEAFVNFLTLLAVAVLVSAIIGVVFGPTTMLMGVAGVIFSVGVAKLVTTILNSTGAPEYFRRTEHGLRTSIGAAPIC